MSNYVGEVRRRRRNLLIVEGNHEKNKLFSLMFQCFPEINIDIMEGNTKKTLKYQMKDWIVKMGYIHSGQSYWEYIRHTFKEIIFHNIHKANWLQNGQIDIEIDKYKKCFERIDLMEILKMQNTFSQDEIQGYIWVLNTCVFFVADYNSALLN